MDCMDAAGLGFPTPFCSAVAVVRITTHVCHVKGEKERESAAWRFQILPGEGVMQWCHYFSSFSSGHGWTHKNKDDEEKKEL